MRLPATACLPPFENSRPCCAFHAQINMRVSARSVQPGCVLVGGAIVATGVTVGAAVAVRSGAFGGTVGAAALLLPPNSPGAKCFVAPIAAANSDAPRRPLASGVSPPGFLVVVIAISFRAKR